MVICLARGADLHMAQLMPLPLTVSCFSKILQIGFTFLVPVHPGSPGKRAVKRVCLCAVVQLELCRRSGAEAMKYALPRFFFFWGGGISFHRSRSDTLLLLPGPDLRAGAEGLPPNRSYCISR